MTDRACTTLAAIHAAGSSADGWRKLCRHLGTTTAKAKKDTTPLPLVTILDSNGLDDALWVLDRTGCDPMGARLFAADCAEAVLHLFEREHPDDPRPREAIRVARDPASTPGQLDAARAAAWAAAQAALDAARAAARAAARDAARAAAWDAAWAAARDAAWAAARDAQASLFRARFGGGQP